MMTKPSVRIKLTLIILLLSSISSHAQNFGWAKQFGNISIDNGNAIALDASGNVYTTGEFAGTIDFDPGPGVFNLNAQNGFDVFVSKLDSGGNFIWALQFGGVYDDISRAITIDASNNVYITGAFNDTADFDPGAGIYNLFPAGNSDIFIVKLDSSGNFIWAKNLGGINQEYASSIAVDASSNVYTTGNFSDTADFDPGSGTFNLITAGQRDIFISKLDAAGNFVWARQMGSTFLDYGYAIKVDAAGNVYTTGSFWGTVDFDPGAGVFNLTTAGYDDIFISKLDASGNFIWARNMGGITYDYSRSIAVDSSGNVYTTGSFEGYADFDPGAGTFVLTQAGSAGGDIFVSKLNASGNFVWAQQFGGTGLGYATSIALDASGNIYTSGYFEGTTDFNPGPGVFDLTSVWFTGGDVYVSKLDPSGNFIWAGKMGGNSYEYGRSIAPDAFGNVYTTGSFTGTADFDPGAGTYNLISAGNLDIFISKLNGVSSTTSIAENDSEGKYKSFPNPTVGGHLTIDLEKEYAHVQVKLKNMMGQEFTPQYHFSGKRISLDIEQVPGVYFIELKADEEQAVFIKIIKQ